MRKSALDRILERVTKDQRGSCWITGFTVRSNGYAGMRFEGKMHYVHRIAYRLLVGPIPEGLSLDHKCGNRLCCNPEHLEPVTTRENNRRAWARFPLGHPSRKTHCSKGHEYGPQDYCPNRTTRRCQECHRTYMRDRMRKLRVS